jgi:hypothetical protein
MGKGGMIYSIMIISLLIIFISPFPWENAQYAFNGCKTYYQHKKIEQNAFIIRYATKTSVTILGYSAKIPEIHVKLTSINKTILIFKMTDADEKYMDEYDQYNFEQDKLAGHHGGKGRSKKEAEHSKYGITLWYILCICMCMLKWNINNNTNTHN